MTPLEEELRAQIAQDGPLTLERYMDLALAHPRHGYYAAHDPLGAGGDFITAPEISQMFGELIGLWAAEAWSAMGEPARLMLAELGPGRGTLMADALRAAQVSAQFRAALDVRLIEISAPLRARQKEALAGAADVPAGWHERPDQVPPGPAVFIANEFFDALPVRHYVKTARGWCERMVGVGADGALAFGLSPQPEPAIRAEAAFGDVLEIGTRAQDMMRALAARIAQDGGAALIIDYGHAETALGETLQAMKGHAFADPLSAPGETDITAHVDFAALKRAALAQGAAVQGPVAQGGFLRELGIEQRAAALKRRASTGQIAGIDAAVARLTGAGENEMGALFKVMAVRHPALPELPGFAVESAA